MKGASWPLFVVRMGYHRQKLTEDLVVAVAGRFVVAEVLGVVDYLALVG